MAPGNFTEVPELGWVWTTFHDYQWDLNYANPAVFRAMLGTMFALANRGIDVLRLDAAPVPVEAAGHQLPEPARGSSAGSGLPCPDAAGRAGLAAQGRGDRQPGPAGAVSRRS
jgi:hypothetical protein